MRIPFLGRHSTLLRPLERHLLDLLADRLSPAGRAVLRAQVKSVNLVQRHWQDKEVNLYCMWRGRPSWDAENLFPSGEQEVKVGTITFRHTARARRISADFWVVGGHIFQLQFDQSPRGLSPEAVTVTT